MKPQTQSQRLKAIYSLQLPITPPPTPSSNPSKAQYARPRPQSPQPQPPQPQNLGTIIRYIGGWFFGTRLVLTLIGLLAHTYLPTAYGKQTSWSPHLWLDLWGVWDSVWYMDIAQNGYSTQALTPQFPEQTNFPFFPLYPLLMRGLGQLIGDPYLAGLLISNGCLLASAYLLYRLVEADSNRKMAKRAVKYLFLFPVSFLLSGVFTESLYLCLSLLCFFLARRQRWKLASFSGMLLSATRPLGVLIMLPLLIEYLQRPRVRSEAAQRYRFDDKPKLLNWDSLWLLLIPLGLLAFCLYNGYITGDFFFFKTNQTAWNREFSSPAFAIWEAVKVGIGKPSFKRLLEVSFGCTALVGLMVFCKRIGLSFWILGLYSLLIPMSAGIASQPRFTVVVFPLFIILAMLSHHRQWDRMLTVFLGLLQGGLMVFWCTGYGLVI